MSDLIDRRAAIDECYPVMVDGEVYEVVQVETLMGLPSAEPKTGRWISDRLVSTNGGTYGIRRCSECEAYYQDIGYGWNFCPTCGARMEGEDNGVCK